MQHNDRRCKQVGSGESIGRVIFSLGPSFSGPPEALLMNHSTGTESVKWLLECIRQLPSDQPVPRATPGYNVYTTQKDHWIGWLDTTQGTGTYVRRTADDRGARYVYNHINEPKMLLWLITAAGLRSEVTRAAANAAECVQSLPKQCAVIRRQAPWLDVADALRRKDGSAGGN